MRHNNRHSGAALRKERARRGISQLQLALTAGCSLGTVGLIERGARLTPEMAERLANALGLDAHVLIEVNDE